MRIGDEIIMDTETMYLGELEQNKELSLYIPRQYWASRMRTENDPDTDTHVFTHGWKSEGHVRELFSDPAVYSTWQRAPILQRLTIKPFYFYDDKLHLTPKTPITITITRKEVKNVVPISSE